MPIELNHESQGTYGSVKHDMPHLSLYDTVVNAIDAPHQDIDKSSVWGSEMRNPQMLVQYCSTRTHQ